MKFAIFFLQSSLNIFEDYKIGEKIGRRLLNIDHAPTNFYFKSFASFIANRNVFECYINNILAKNKNK